MSGNMRDGKQAAARDPLIGQVFGGRYDIHQLIGRGGVGLVYLAEDTETGEDVVLKLLSPDWSRKPQAVRRFEREAERLGGVHHPNIVRLLDQGHDAGRAYLVMEYLQGELLSDYIAQEQALDLPTFVPIAAQVLKGIGHAHSRGVMLRDIKPANIMLCERKGRANFVKILDFGLAKLIRDEQPVTEEHVLGTAGYLAPEVIQGDEDLDLRVDVFALGALFYFMLSGRLPFEGSESATVFYKTIHDDPIPLHDVLPTDHALPEGLITLVHRCLAKRRTGRPDDANAVVEDLIDVVPASLFRLPKVRLAPGVPQLRRPETGETPVAGYGNSGMVQLVGEDAVSGVHPVVPASSDAVPPDPPRDEAPQDDPESVTITTGPHARESTRPEAALPPTASPPAGNGRLIAVAAAVLLVGGGIALSVMGGSDTAAAVHGNTAVAAATTAPDSATAPPEGSAHSPDAAAPGRPDVALPERLENAPAADPTDAPPPTAFAPVDIGSRPLANLTIDGEASGTTPFVGKLSTGTHTIRMTARGYQAWEGELDVRSSGTEDLRVRLVPKGSTKKKPRQAGPSEEASKPDASKPEASKPEASGPAVSEPKTPQAKPPKSVFLPTKDESGKPGGGVFLPTKD